MTSPCAPDPFKGMTTKERNKLERDFDRVVDKVVGSIVIRKSPRHIMREIYMAGLYHGTLASKGWEE